MSPPCEVEVKMEIEQTDSRPALTPPTSENTDKKDDESESELSDLEPEEPSEEHPVQPKVEVEEERAIGGGPRRQAVLRPLQHVQLAERDGH